MAPLKIALIRQRYNAFGGAERFVTNVMNTLENHQTVVTIITRNWPTVDQNHVIICNPFFLGSLWRDWGFKHRLKAILSEVKFDLIQSHERIAGCDIYRAGDGVHREWLRQRRRLCNFWENLQLELNPYHRYLLAMEKQLFNSSRLRTVICNSQMVKMEIQEWFNFPENKIQVIYNGVDTKKFHPNLRDSYRFAIRRQLNIPLNAPLFIFVGSGFIRKGLATLLRALSQLTKNAYLLIIGKDKRQKMFQLLAKRLNIVERVYFLGGQLELAPYYGAADVFVLPTLYDPFPNAALEAFACGLPVITSNKSGAAELIHAGNNGFVCDALEYLTLAEFMKKSYDFTNYERNAARATVENFTLDNMAQALINLYQSYY